jgi:uncharacterized protein YbjT (DUF2867 family)
MKVVVIGGTGLIGSKLVARLRARGHEALAAAPDTGVDTITGQGLADSLRGASAVVDVSNSPSFEDQAVLQFFETSTRNLLAAELDARIDHHVALSIVGADKVPESGYLRAKTAQEKLIKSGRVPYSIVRAGQFFEFFKSIAAAATEGNTVRLSPALLQPMAATDVAAALETVVLGSPVNGTVEIAGPESIRLDEFVRQGLAANGDARTVITDPEARYFGARLGDGSALVPGAGARLGQVRFQDWLKSALPLR